MAILTRLLLLQNVLSQVRDIKDPKISWVFEVFHSVSRIERPRWSDAIEVVRIELVVVDISADFVTIVIAISFSSPTILSPSRRTFTSGRRCRFFVLFIRDPYEF